MKEVLMILYTFDSSGYMDTITTTRVSTQQECRYIIQSLNNVDKYLKGKCITVTKLKDTHESH